VKGLSRILRGVVTLALLGYIVSNVSLENLWMELQGVHLGWYLLGLGISVFSIAINAFKWRLLLLYLGYRRSYGYLFTLQLYGILFNNIFPTSIGGDAVRAYCASRGDVTTDGIRPTDVVASIFVQRLTGLVALVLLAIISSILLFDANARYDGVLIASLFGIISVLTAFACFNQRLASMLRILLDRRFPRVAYELETLARTVRRYRDGTNKIVTALILSFFSQLMVCLSVYFLGLSLGIEIPVWYYFFYIPVATMVMMGPSIGGHGLREGAFFLLFASAGGAKAISLSLLFLSCATLEGLVGGLAFMITGVRWAAIRTFMGDHLKGLVEAGKVSAHSTT
jgi:uncharacterized protein (TIRG00374 family)